MSVSFVPLLPAASCQLGRGKGLGMVSEIFYFHSFKIHEASSNPKNETEIKGYILLMMRFWTLQMTSQRLLEIDWEYFGFHG